jgi:hypothetical protein
MHHRHKIEALLSFSLSCLLKPQRQKLLNLLLAIVTSSKSLSRLIIIGQCILHPAFQIVHVIALSIHGTCLIQKTSFVLVVYMHYKTRNCVVLFV